MIVAGVPAALNATSKIFCIAGSAVVRSVVGESADSRNSRSASRPSSLRRPRDLFQHLPDLLRRERLGNVIHRPGAHRLHRVLNRGVRGEHHHVQVRVHLQQLRQQIHPALRVQFQVQKRGVEMRRLQFLQRHLAVLGAAVSWPMPSSAIAVVLRMFASSSIISTRIQINLDYQPGWLYETVRIIRKTIL